MSEGIEGPINNNNHQDLPFEPIDSYRTIEKKERSYVEKELEDRLAKMDESSDLTKMILLTAAINAYLSRYATALGIKQLLKLMPEILERTKLNAATYNSRAVWILSGLGAIATIGFSIVGFGGFSSVLAKGGDGQLVNAAIQRVSAIQGGGNALGQFLGTSSQLWGQKLTGEREVGGSFIQLLNLIRDKLKDYSGSDARKVAESLDLLMRIIQTYHDTCMKANGGQ